VSNVAFDINEDQGKESGLAQADGSQYKNKEGVIGIGGAAARSFFGNCQRNSHS